MRKLTTPLHHGRNSAFRQGPRGSLRTVSIWGCWAPRGSWCPVTSGRCTPGWGSTVLGAVCPHPAPLPPRPLTQESGSPFPLHVSSHPAPSSGSLWRGGGVCTNLLCLLSPSGPLRPPPPPRPPPQPHPIAFYSMRNLSRPSLTQYELDSKSPAQRLPDGPGLPRGGERGLQGRLPAAQGCDHLRLPEEKCLPAYT